MAQRKGNWPVKKTERARVSQANAVLRQLPQVHSIAYDVQRQLPSCVQHEDLVQWGVLGLLQAAQRFDPGKNIRFGTFARERIRGAMLDALRELDPASRNLRQKDKRIRELRNRLSFHSGREASDDEVARELGVETLYLKQLFQLIERCRGLSSADCDVTDVEDRISTPDEESPFHQCLSSERRNVVANALTRLPPNERLVLVLRYFNECNVQEIAERTGLSEARVSQLHASGLTRMRRVLHFAGPLT